MDDLKNNQSIIIKPCDKGGSICIMKTRDCLSKIHTQLQHHNTYKLLTYSPINAIVYDARILIHYMHSQQIIDTATIEFYCLPGIHAHLFFMGYQKYTNQTALSTLLLQDVMAQLTVSHPILPNSYSHYLKIFHRTLRTQNISLTKLKIIHHSEPMHSWSQLMYVCMCVCIIYLTSVN